MSRKAGQVLAGELKKPRPRGLGARRVRFSERYGYRTVLKPLQIESIDGDLRNRLWNVVFLVQGLIREDGWRSLFYTFWEEYLKRPLDEMPRNKRASLREYFFACQWHEVYSLLELVAADEHVRDRWPGFVRECNNMLEAECSGYRFVGEQIAPITSGDEIEAIEEAMTDAGLPTGAREHLKRALAMLSDRIEPDYRNSIKESISSVESVCRHVTRDPSATLADALKAIRQTHGAQVHGALNAAFHKLYGYTSDEQGVRHAMMDDPQVAFAEAKFMLVACSAFINYVVAKLADAPTAAGPDPSL